MTAEMTSKQRLLTAIRHQEPDRVPISPRYFDYLHGVEGCDCWMHYFRFGLRMGIDPILIVGPRWNNYLYRHVGPYDDLEGVDVDVEVRQDAGRLFVRRQFRTPAGDLADVRQLPGPDSAVTCDHNVQTLVKGWADLERIAFVLPKPETAYVGDLAIVKDLVGDRGLVEFQATQGTDQFLVDALGVEGTLLLYYDDRPLLKELVRIFNGYTQAIMRRGLEAGAEMVFDPWYNTSLSVGWSPAQWRELFLPRIRENVALAHSYGALYHYYDDGRMDRTLESLAEAGVDVVDTLAPSPLGDVDLASAKARVGDRLCLKGGIDQVNVILPGTPAQIREAVRWAIEVAATGGGYIVGTADSIRPETPWENVQAYFDAAHEYSRRAYARV